MPIDPDTGEFIALTERDYRLRGQEFFEQEIGEANDWTSDKVVGNLIAWAAQELGEATEDMDALRASRSPQNALASQLLELGELVGFLPRPATRTRVQIQLTFDDDDFDVVPVGTRFLPIGGEGPALVTLNPGNPDPPSTVIGVIAEIEDAGPLLPVRDPASGENLYEPEAALDKLVEASAFVEAQGVAPETIESFRERFAQRGAVTGLQTNAGLREALLSLPRSPQDLAPFVSAAFVTDNPGTTDITISGRTVRPGETFVALFPGIYPAAETEGLANLLYVAGVGGTRYARPVLAQGLTFEVTGGDGQPKEVGWHFAEAFEYDVEVEVLEVEPGFAFGDVEEAVREAVRDYGASVARRQTLGAQSAIRRLQILRAVGRVDGVAAATVLLAPTGGTPGAVDIIPTELQFPALQAVDVIDGTTP